MKAVILAGGFGTRISEESHLVPKPMVEIGGKPILWHILKMYSAHNINHFIICCGYKAYVINEYFSNYALHTADITIDMIDNRMTIHHRRTEPWKITLVDTGIHTMTGGRLRRVKEHVGNETFCLTYGDGVSNVNLTDLITFHRRHGKQATVTSIQPEARFGVMTFNGDEVTSFDEKPKGDGSWINGGFFVLEPTIFDDLPDDKTIFERDPLKNLSARRQLMAYRHSGFWAAVDTLRDKNHLEELWGSGKAPWKIWE